MVLTVELRWNPKEMTIIPRGQYRLSTGRWKELSLSVIDHFGEGFFKVSLKPIKGGKKTRFLFNEGWDDFVLATSNRVFLCLAGVTRVLGVPKNTKAFTLYYKKLENKPKGWHK